MVIVTWMKTFRAWKEARRLGLPISVTTCLLRDGKHRFIPSNRGALTFSGDCRHLLLPVSERVRFYFQSDYSMS